jgi:hypothetical protein
MIECGVQRNPTRISLFTADADSAFDAKKSDSRRERQRLNDNREHHHAECEEHDQVSPE